MKEVGYWSLYIIVSPVPLSNMYPTKTLEPRRNFNRQALENKHTSITDHFQHVFCNHNWCPSPVMDETVAGTWAARSLVVYCSALGMCREMRGSKDCFDEERQSLTKTHRIKLGTENKIQWMGLTCFNIFNPLCCRAQATGRTVMCCFSAEEFNVAFPCCRALGRWCVLGIQMCSFVMPFGHLNQLESAAFWDIVEPTSQEKYESPTHLWTAKVAPHTAIGKHGNIWKSWFQRKLPTLPILHIPQ